MFRMPDVLSQYSLYTRCEIVRYMFYSVDLFFDLVCYVFFFLLLNLMIGILKYVISSVKKIRS